MQKATRWLVIGIFGVLVGGLASPVAAQDVRKAEVSGGYNFLTAKGSGDDSWENFPVGWYADVAYNISPMLGVVGQVSGNYKSETEDGNVEVKFKVHPFMGGVRVSGRSNEMFVPYGQVLVGGVMLKASADAFNFSASETDLAVQFGGGVNILLPNRPIGIRVGADFIRAMGKDTGEVTGGDNTNVIRVGVGVVIPLGGTL